jgi:hypothetical protein
MGIYLHESALVINSFIHRILIYSCQNNQAIFFTTTTPNVSNIEINSVLHTIPFACALLLLVTEMISAAEILFLNSREDYEIYE